MGSLVGNHCGWLNMYMFSYSNYKTEEVYRAERVELVTYLYQKLHLIPLELSITT